MSNDCYIAFFFFQQKTAYEMRISDWSSDVCSSDLVVLEQAKESLEQNRHQFDLAFEEKRKKLTQGDELPPGELKMIKVYLAVKLRLQPGHKMAGRPGKKSVVSRITAVEELQHIAVGTLRAIVLNLLGVTHQ